MTMRELAELVRAMRRLQKAYFATRKPSLLMECKDAERRLDQAIKDFFDPPQPGLFYTPGEDE